MSNFESAPVILTHITKSNLELLFEDCDESKTKESIKATQRISGRVLRNPGWRRPSPLGMQHPAIPWYATPYPLLALTDTFTLYFRSSLYFAITCARYVYASSGLQVPASLVCNTLLSIGIGRHQVHCTKFSFLNRHEHFLTAICTRFRLLLNQMLLAPAVNSAIYIYSSRIQFF